MVKFAHLGDCHLGSWRQPELQDLNFQCFQKAIDSCIDEKIDFILVAGDLFDSAYPPIEILKQTFAEFRKIFDAGIKCYMIAGSHDYSVSGKTFLDVLEKAGFCEICKYEEIKDEENNTQEIILHSCNHKGFEIYGFPGKKSGLEIHDLKKIKVKESSNFRILMLHTSLTEAIGNLPIESISLKELPKAEYYALAHLHINFNKDFENRKAIYSGPIFPNSFQELEDLGGGSFYIIEVSGFVEAKKQEIRIKEVLPFNIEIKNALAATQQILSEFEKQNLNDKIVLLRLYGVIEQGTSADIDYGKIKQYLDEKQAYSFLKNTHKLTTREEEKLETDIQITSSDMNKVEEALIEEYEGKNPDQFNKYILPLIHALDLKKQEDEKSVIFESRLLSELNKVLGLDLK